MAASAKVKKVHLLSALTFGHFAWAKLGDPQYAQERDQVLMAIAWNLQTLVITSLLSGIALVAEVSVDFALKIPDASFWSSGWLIGAIALGAYLLIGVGGAGVAMRAAAQGGSKAYPFLMPSALDESTRVLGPPQKLPRRSLDPNVRTAARVRTRLYIYIFTHLVLGKWRSR